MQLDSSDIVFVKPCPFDGIETDHGFDAFFSMRTGLRFA
jgi:hypothetical protein